MISQNKIGKAFITLALYLGLIVLFSGCSSTGNDQNSYVIMDSMYTAFIQWTEVDEELAGQLQLYHIDTDSLELESSSHSFNGLHNENSISLKFTSIIFLDSFSGQIWTGTLQKNELVLVISSNDGELNTIVFHKGTVEDYNENVADLQSELFNLQQQRVQQDLLNNIVKNVTDGINKITYDLKFYKDASDFEYILNEYNYNWEIMLEDNEIMHDDASLYDYNFVQDDLNMLRLDNDYFNSIDYSLESEINYLNDAIQQINNDIATLQNSLSKLRNLDSSKANDYDDSVNMVIYDAEGFVNNALNSITQVRFQAEQINQNADVLLNEAEKFVSDLKIS